MAAHNRELYDGAETALDMVLEEVEKVIEFINQAASEACQKDNLDTARHLIDQSSQVKAFLKKAQDLAEEWDKLIPSGTEPSQAAAATRPTPRSYGKHLPRGLRTPELAYFVPILQVLVKMGGKGHVPDVLKQVEEIMKLTLNEYDYELLPSASHDPRWYNTAQWARQKMVDKGLLSSKSPFGIWEITEAGKQHLARNV